ncbi:DUF4150 domain-containing protein [Agrobacterium sp. a22-2]|uniref:PAAR-like domain-containing protein n=1 Tax=Agrobacterium sp. a22-2 TaxID=2283840 RepID=UPI00144553BF|nr:PAAR-like domain-containing protein [Agrobacterium sp. a22-2]NKN37392.1 DUF4150 domain-containing protein [Agrobacterium sp. a22-2]
MSLPSPSDIRIGDPNYPAPWTTSLPLEALRDTDAARIVSLAPDVCLTPVGSSVVPIPYPIVDYCGHDRSYTESVRFTGYKAMVMRSCTTHVHGDKPGVRKGVRSGTVESICEPISHAPQIRAEGSNVIRHLDRFWMNSRNTQGEAIFVRDSTTFAAPKDDDPIRGSLRYAQLAQAETPNRASDVAPVLGFLAPAGGVGALTGGGTAVGGGAVAGGAAATGGGAATAGGAAATATGVGLGTVLLGIGVFAVGVLWPTNKTNFSDFIPQDDYEARLAQDAEQRIGGLPPWDSGTSIKSETLAQIDQRRQQLTTQAQPQTNTQAQPQATPLATGANGRVNPARCYVLPLFFSTPARGTRAEQQRQLSLQQAVLNAKNPCQAAADIARYPVNKPLGEAARPIERRRLVNARAQQIRALNPSTNSTQALAQAQTWATGKDAIHTLDMVAGGQPTVFSGLGGSSENRSIGSHWRNGKAAQLDAYAINQCQAGCPNMQTQLIAT